MFREYMWGKEELEQSSVVIIMVVELPHTHGPDSGPSMHPLIVGCLLVGWLVENNTQNEQIGKQKTTKKPATAALQ